jgi:hypothetical protein
MVYSKQIKASIMLIFQERSEMDMKSDIRRLNNTVANNEFQEPASLALQERQIVSSNEFQGLNLLILQRHLESYKFKEPTSLAFQQSRL